MLQFEASQDHYLHRASLPFLNGFLERALDEANKFDFDFILINSKERRAMINNPPLRAWNARN
jgi:hypothetical protein